MANPHFDTQQYPSEKFVESAGAVLFRISTQEICLVHHLLHDHHVLPKGRRNCGESRQEAALRELVEETGHHCHLFPVNMTTRAPPAVETEQTPDEAGVRLGVYEPFYLQIRNLAPGEVKLIWWYIAAVAEEQQPVEQSPEDKGRFMVEFYGYDMALERLTFASDREIIERAVRLVTEALSANEA